MVSDGFGVAPDGSPVAVYLALPAEPEFTPVLQAVRPGNSVLDLGCGVGRLANVLAARGVAVTGVDESGEMLAHVDPAVERVAADLEGLDLEKRFDVVVLASHLINVADPVQRRRFLRAAADHVVPGGLVLVEHWEVPDHGPPPASIGRAGPVGVEFRVLHSDGDSFQGRVDYRLGDQVWSQTFWACLLDEEGLDRELLAVGLQRRGRLSPKWLAATPDGEPGPAR